jgi:predicted lactoylglutathione lyase
MTTTMKPRIAVLNLGVADLARSRAFYEGMGWVARPESSERAVFFELEWSWLALFPRDRLASLSKSSPEGSGYPGFCFSHNVRTPEEVNAILERAKALGGSVVLEPEDGPERRIGYMADPDGFQWEIAWTPRWHELTD